MGYMTTITILNDAFNQIQKHPKQFVDNIATGMNGVDGYRDRSKRVNTFNLGNHCNPMQVAEAHHADDFKVYLTFQNLMVEYGYGGSRDIRNLDLRMQLLGILKRLVKEEENAIKKLEKNKE